MLGLLLVSGAWSQRVPVAAPIVVTTAYVQRADTLRRNETPSELFLRHNIAGAELLQLLDEADGINPRRIRAGQVFQFRYAVHTEKPDRVTVRLGDDRLLTLKRDSTSWRGESEAIVWSPEKRLVRGEIRSSLNQTIHTLVADSVLDYEQRQQLIWDLADGVFGWVIDFYRDNYPGDRFEILYERLISPLSDVRFGRVLAARVETRGQVNTAYVMTGADGRNAYYDAEGRSLRRAFKRYPAEFRRIASGFSWSRFHPILRRDRPHLGVDYSATTGTTIVATGDGTVIRAGRWGGYGLVVTIGHARDIETRYAHMSRIARGIRGGIRVRQGQKIGEVGMSGLATAPHVHYEFIKNGRHTNPRDAVDFGPGDPVPTHRRAEFEALRAYYNRLLTSEAPSATAAGAN